jgi:capsular exopolysaccharide synthesis family protein
MMAGSLAGILLSAAVVYLLEKIDKRIKSVEQVRELFEYTLLATIPDFSKTNRSVNAIATSDERRLAIPVLERSHSFITESYRMLHANLTFFNSDKLMQVIVVTSSVPKEGKSTTVANLAAVIANLGYRVLVVDADLRRPSQHEIWQIPNEAGLKNFIATRGDLSNPIIQKVMDNLYVLSAGAMNSSSSVFIDSRSIAGLIRQCRNKYDYVIFDTPPLAVTADAHILGKIADGVMLVTRPSIADSINSKQAKESLDGSGQNIVGIVVNGVIPEKEFHSYREYAAVGHEESSSRHAAPRRWLDNFKFFRR